MKVTVTQEHIAKGDCKSPQKCMIAAAIKTMDEAIHYVSVRTNGITITKRNEDGESRRQHWAVPMHVAKKIVAFDRGDPVTPFSFTPKFIDEVVIPPVSAKQAKANKIGTKKHRDALKAAGIPRPEYGPKGRVAGV